MAIDKVGIVGAGTMGGGIATNVAAHGLEVVLFDVRGGSADKAVADAGVFYARAVDKGRMTAEAAATASGRLQAVGDLAALDECGLVIEAVFEDFALKAGLFEELSPILPAATIVATNTSCLRVSDLAEHIVAPARFLGLHYFSPAQVNPVVEVVRGAATDDPTYSVALAFIRETGKQPIPCRDAWGFAINRFFCPYTNEAARMLDEELGTTGEIDLVAKACLGVAAGPFQVMNLIKPRINLHAIRNLAPLGAFYAPAAAMAAVGDAERSWTVSNGDAMPDAARAGAIADRLLGATFLPVLAELDEDVAEPAAIDQGAREALKFGKAPCALMDSLGRQEVERLVRPICERYGIAMPRSTARVGSLLAPA